MTITSPARANGLRTFLIMWFGQFVSYIGTEMTRFALMAFAFAQTGEATTLALLGFFAHILHVAFSPLGGVIVDRYDRRIVMMIADTGAGLMTLTLAVLFFTGRLEIWHMFVTEALTGAFESFQRPAYIASSTMLVPKHQFGRLNALRSLAYNGSRIVGPFFASIVLVTLDIGAVFIIDMITFGIAILTLVVIRIPRPRIRPENVTGTLLQDLVFGVRYIFRRPGLFGLMIFFLFIHLVASLTYFGVLNAMILARTGGDTVSLASVQAALGGAAVIGGLILGAWGGPKKQIHMLFFTMIASFMLGDFLLGTGQHLTAWFIGAAAASFFIPFIVAADRTIWQKKVSPDAQGRVFSIRTMFVEAMIPLGFLIAGPLADRVFEPAMRLGTLNMPVADVILRVWDTPLANGSLVEQFSGLVGTGPGAGMGLMFVCTSIMGVTVSLVFYAIPAIRKVEDDLPDFEDDEDETVLEPLPYGTLTAPSAAD